MTCEFQNCTVPYCEVRPGVCFAFPSTPKVPFLKTEAVGEGNCFFNAVCLTDGTFTCIDLTTPVLAYPMAKVIV